MLWHRIARGHRATIARRPTLSPTSPMHEHPASQSRSARWVEAHRAATAPFFWRCLSVLEMAMLYETASHLLHPKNFHPWCGRRPSLLAKASFEGPLSRSAAGGRPRASPCGHSPVERRASHDITPRKVNAVLLPGVLSIVSRPFRIAGGLRFCVAAWRALSVGLFDLGSARLGRA